MLLQQIRIRTSGGLLRFHEERDLLCLFGVVSRTLHMHIHKQLLLVYVYSGPKIVSWYFLAIGTHSELLYAESTPNGPTLAEKLSGVILVN
jgi:hypothetical protein